MEAVSSPIAWLILGLVLLVFEIMSGTFVLLFFAVAAFVVGLLAWLAVIESNVVQMVIFGVLGGGGLLIFKDKVRAALQKSGHDKFKIDAGESITIDTDIAIKGQAEVNYQGTKWTAVNDSGRALHAGEKVTIARIDGVKLVVK